MPIIGQVVREALRIGPRLFPRTYKTIVRADIAIHKSLYGASGGRGVRHGRDIGSLTAGAYRGLSGEDDLDATENEYGHPSGEIGKARRRYGNKRGSRSGRNYYSSANRRQSKYCKCGTGKRRFNY